MSEPKYKIRQGLWTVLDCDPVSCVVIRTGRNIMQEPEYLVQPDVNAGHFKQEYWTAEDRLYDNELDAVEEAARLWERKHKKAVEEADYILSHKLSSLMMRKAELQEQQNMSLDDQTLTKGYYEVPADKSCSSVTVKTAAKVGIVGGMMECVLIDRGGVVHLQSGKLDSVTVSAGGQLTVDGGYVHSASIIGSLTVTGGKGKTPYLKQAVMNDGADAYLGSAIGSGFWVRTGSVLRLGNGAVAIDTTIGSDGKVNLGSGASMSMCQICSGGTLTMYGSDARIDLLTVNNGGIVRYVEDKR